MEASILSLASEQLTLANAGGKGANLSRLARAGFNVPGGFVVTTAAYERFTASLRTYILKRLKSVSADELDALEEASVEIRGWFRSMPMPEDIAAAIRAAYAGLGGERVSNGSRQAVAVRSSATAEDLPEMSFAGQQDTYLNVIGEDALLEAVVNCWSSLWTARAIGYRGRNNLSQGDIALAVVVQTMVQSEVSGVMFTANPLTGLRGEIVIDATFGLGEALVAGQVEPDHYVISALGVDEGLQVREKKLGAKALAIQSRQGGGIEKIESEASGQQALSDANIRVLAELGARVAALYNVPQDIEWALADKKFYLLQSRPITSLYPLPEGLPAEPLKVMFSFGAGQGMLDPLTPLGRDGICSFVLSIGGRLGHRLTLETQQAFFIAGERIYINITNAIRNPLGRRALPLIMSALEPGSLGSLPMLFDDPRLAPIRAPMSVSTTFHLGRFFLPMIGRAISTLIDPDSARERVLHRSEKFYLRNAAQAERAHTFKERVAFTRQALNETPAFALQNLIPVFAPGYAMLNSLSELTKDLPDAARLTLEVTRGLPHNVTTEMDLALWRAARTIRDDITSAGYFNAHTALELAEAHLKEELPDAAQQAVRDFLDRYGMRGTAEIDSGRIRWREDPTPVMQSLLSYMEIDDARAPDIIFQRAEKEAEAAIEKLINLLRGTRRGPLKSRIARALTRRVRALAGMREYPKFFLVRLMWLIRQEMLKSGQSLVEAGIFEHADDIYFLHLTEVYALEAWQTDDGAWRVDDTLKAHGSKSHERRKIYDREKLRRQTPRILLSDGRAFYGDSLVTPVADGDSLSGSPVSPGVVEGVVHVVFDPHHARLVPGEILVCPGTDPAWTPLFLSAGGLIMEVGGLMTHGSVVAREYGIPAVVGVHQVTQKLKNGQRVRVDGNSGQITLLN